MRGRGSNLAATLCGTAAPGLWIKSGVGFHPGYGLSSMASNVTDDNKRHLCARGHLCAGSNFAYPGPRGVSPSRDPGSSAKIAAQRHRIFVRNWIPDLRAGSPALVRDTRLRAVTDDEKRHLWQKRHLCARPHGVADQGPAERPGGAGDLMAAGNRLREGVLDPGAVLVGQDQRRQQLDRMAPWPATCARIL